MQNHLVPVGKTEQETQSALEKLHDRRSFIKIMGSSAVILGACGIGYGWATSRTPQKALMPWQNARDSNDRDPRVKALSYAILAPNPHNRQAWLVDLKKPNCVVLYCDLTRLLPETDPFHRQILIGHGCFLELLDIAARELGYITKTVLFPEGSSEKALDKRPIAVIDFMPSAAVDGDPLFRQILERRTTRKPFDNKRPVEHAKAKALCKATIPTTTAKFTVEDALLGSLRDLTIRAHVLEAKEPRTHIESVNLMRIGKQEIEQNPDGISLSGPMLEGLNLVGQLSREQIADMKSSAYQQGLDMYAKMIGSAMGFVWIITEANTRTDQVEAGRSWVRMNLKATELGIAINPHSQALQEYPEMKELFDRLHESLQVESPRRIQMFARIGYGPKVEASPRWDVKTRII